MDQQPDQTPPPLSYKFSYSGSGTELAFIMFKNILLTILTLGIYMAWGRTNNRRYIWGSTSFHGDRATYTGQGKELFYGWMKVMGIYIALYAAFNLLAKFVSPLIGILAGPLYIYLFAIMVYGGSRYRINRTTWRGVHFGMDKNAQLTREFVTLVFKYALLTAFSLGLCFPMMVHNIRKFLTDKTRFGNSYFNYTGTLSDLYKIYAKGIFLSIVTFGIYLSWFKVEMIKYRLEHTRFQNARFKSELSGSNMFFFSVGAFFLTLFTAGLAIPWVINWGNKLIINSLELNGYINFDEIDNYSPQGDDAAADAAAEEYDVDLAI